MAITFTEGLAGKTVQDKAQEYNTLLGQGFSDAQIKAAADAMFGVQPESDWQYLTNLAKQGAVNTPTSTATPTFTPTATVQAPLSMQSIANAPGLGTQGIGVNVNSGITVTDEVANSFKSVFGRDPTASELEGLRSTYGMSIEPGEFNEIVLSKRDANVGYGVPTTQVVTPVYEYTTSKGEYGEDVQTPRIAGYKDAQGNAVDPSLVTAEQVYYGGDGGDQQTVYSTSVKAPTYSGEGGVINNLTNQILAQGTTANWGGEGYGSAAKSAADMALLLAAHGLTDINQFGVRNKTVTTGDVYGENGDIIQPSTSYTQPEYYNKATGQAINPYYDKASGNTWSGTFAGEGSTAYKVQFKPDGTPIFYSQYGGSSNDLAQMLDDPIIGSIVQTAAAYFGGPLGTAALNLAMGKDVDDVAKAALTSYVAGELASGVSGNAEVIDALGKTGANIAGRVAGSAVSGGGTEGALAALVSGGVGAAMPEITSMIPGYADLPPFGKEFVNNAISSTLRDGNLSQQDLINAAVRAGTVAARTASTNTTGGITNRISDDMTEAGAAAFADAKRTGASDAEALAASNALTRIAEANETFDGSAYGSQREAMDAAIAEGLDKFTFGGKTFTIDNSAAQIRDFENSVAAEVKAANDLRAKSDSEFGDLAGAQAAATARNTVAIGNAEADNAEEAAYLAKVRDPSATSFTFDGKTYTISASQSQMTEANKTATLAEIKDLPNFNDAYARARSALGPNQTFEWNGKQYSTATAAERSDLSAPKVQAATDESAAETARLARLNQDLVTGNAPDQSAAETNRLANLNAGLKSMEKTSFLGQIYKDLNEQFRLQGVAANEYLKNNPNSPITESVSTAFEAAGELQRNLGGVALAFDNKPLADLIIKGGTRLQEAGQSIGSGPQDTKNWKDTIDLIDKAKGFEKVAVIAGRIMDGTSGLGRQVELELRQELPALFLGGGLLRPTMIASGLIDTADTGGAAVVDAYDEVVKKGGTHAEGLTAGRRAGAAAAATEAAIQLTLGKLGDFAAGKLDNIVSKGTTKIASEGVVEGSQEAGASAAVDLALGNAVDVNRALTQGVVGAAVGKGTAATTAPVDAAQTDTLNQTASNTGATGSTATDLGAIGTTRPGSEVVVGTDLGSIGNVTPAGDAAINSTVVPGVANATAVTQPDVTVEEAQQTMADLGLNVSDSAAVNLATQINNATAAGTSTGATTSALTGAATGSLTSGATVANISNNVTTQIGSGSDAASVVGSTITSSLNTGSDATTVINSSVAAAINAGGNTSAVVGSAVTAAANAGTSVDAAVASSVAAAINTGANVNTAVTAAVDAAVNAGNNVTVSSNANVTTVTNATTNTTTNINTNTGVATTVDANTNVTTTVDAASNTTTVVDTNTNTTSQTKVDANNNTQTTVVADANNNTNTQTVVNNNTNTTTSTTVNTNSNTTTQTTINANTNTQTTVVTDTNTNTQTTVNINTNTGEITKITETTIPPSWEPPVIEPPKIPEVPPAVATEIPAVKPPVEPAKPAVPKPPSLQGSAEQRGGGGFGLPSGINVDPASLRSKVTGGAIDPLARVKQAQAELEREVMMNQLDPRFAAVIQQRSDPQQQAQQYDKDIGALAKLLSGEPSGPANEGKYYSYGSEDSIDDILGGRQRSYKEGGYVQPLMAAEGGMALPLLAKSGGALGKYNGREDFKEGKHVAGDGDGQSDDIPAWLADGEFVFPADVVSALGNGSTKAGTDKLYEMMHGIRDRARSKGPKDLPPPAFKSPLDYLKSSKRSK